MRATDLVLRIAPAFLTLGLSLAGYFWVTVSVLFFISVPSGGTGTSGDFYSSRCSGPVCVAPGFAIGRCSASRILACARFSA